MLTKITNHLREFFGISPKEARGSLVLMALMFLFLWTPFFFRRFALPYFPLPQENINTKRLDSLVEVLNRNDSQHVERAPFYKEAPHFSKISPTNFDPNTATTDELMNIGIPPFLAKRIEKFRSKGGKFKKKEDLKNIYDFPSSLYQNLEKYIVINASSTINSEIEPFKKYSGNQTFIKTGNQSTFKITSFDINTSDTTQLIRLKGIGSKLAIRILKFRDGLGGFYSENQYMEIYGLDSLALTELSKYAKVMSPVKKIAINTATLEDLTKHSYLRNKRLASVIINYREQHGSFQSLEDLKKVKALDEATLQKLAPYIAY